MTAHEKMYIVFDYLEMFYLDDIYRRLEIDGTSGLHMVFNRALAFTISGRSWSREVTPSRAIPRANSSERTVSQTSQHHVRRITHKPMSTPYTAL